MNVGSKLSAFIVFAALTFFFQAKAQVTIGADVLPNPSAVLDLQSNTNTGLLLPRVVLTDTIVHTPLAAHVKGMFVYSTQASADGKIKEGIYYNDGVRWWHLAALDPTNLDAWYTTGNKGTTSGKHFLGTTDNQPLMFRVNNIPAGFISTEAAVDATTGNNNAFGAEALGDNVNAGKNNNAFGSSALTTNNTGNNNSAFGNSAMQLNSSGSDNTAVGFDALSINSTGSNNTAIGYLAGSDGVAIGSNNIAIGNNTGFTLDGSNRMNIGNAIFGVNMKGTPSAPYGTIGIGTSAPDTSAVLDLTAENKGFLPPRVNLTSATDATTILNPATGLLVFNVEDANITTTLDDKAYYYNSGTPADPLWTMLQQYTPSAGVSVKKILYTGTAVNTAAEVVIGKFKFRMGSTSNGPVPQFALATAPPANVTVYYHFSEYYSTDGYYYASFNKTFTTANYMTYVNLKDAGDYMNNTERDEVWITYPGDSSMYQVEFLIMGPSSPTATNPETYAIIVSQY